MKKHKQRDTDFLHISTRVRALENKMLNRERVERMLDARSLPDALKPLSECGYDVAATDDPAEAARSVEAAIVKNRIEMFTLMTALSPVAQLVDVFRIKYDYHNIKTIIKSEQNPGDGDRCIDTGRVPAAALAEMIKKNDLRGLDKNTAAAVTEARALLARTQDSQLSDILLDRAMYAAMSECAEESGSSFLAGYIRLMIDSANLRTAVRLLRMENGREFMPRTVIEDGNVSVRSICDAVADDYRLIEKLYLSTPLSSAAVLGIAAAADRASRLTAFEKACDDGLNAYLRGARAIAFGDAPPAAYIAAKENEYTLIRTLTAGIATGLEKSKIRERLRDLYV